MIFHSPLLNILINLVSVGKYNFLNWGTFVPQGTVYGVFLMGTVPGLNNVTTDAENVNHFVLSTNGPFV
jgi:hypothetical protein